MDAPEAMARRTAPAEPDLPTRPGLPPDGAIGLEAQTLDAGRPRRVLEKSDPGSSTSNQIVIGKPPGFRSEPYSEVFVTATIQISRTIY